MDKKKLMEYQMTVEKIKQLQEQVQSSEQQIIEAMGTIDNLDEFSKVEDNTEILLPIHNGIFVKAFLKKEDHLLVNIGASVVCNKTVDETKVLIEEQKNDLQKLRAQMIKNIEILTEKASGLEKELS